MGKPRRGGVQHAGDRIPGLVEEPLQPLEPVVGCSRRGSRQSAFRDPRPHDEPLEPPLRRPRAVRLLELGIARDAQGWGWEVTSTGYGDLQGGSDRNRFYTDTFSGTSSASPIIVGALACTQGVLKAKNMPLMTSARGGELLRATGSPQQAAPSRPVSQRIGNRPNLRELIPAALRQWVHNKQITITYALTSPQNAWAYVQDIGWRRIATGSPDGVTNVFALACEAQASGKPVHVYIDDSQLYNIWLS